MRTYHTLPITANQLLSLKLFLSHGIRTDPMKELLPQVVALLDEITEPTTIEHDDDTIDPKIAEDLING